MKGKRFLADLLKSGAVLATLLTVARVLPASAEEAPPPPPFFALCHDTHDARNRTLDEQAKMLADLGFDGVAHLWMDDVESRLASVDREDLRLFQVIDRVNLAETPPYDRKRWEEVLPLLSGRQVQIALLITGAPPSDETVDDRAIGLLREMADCAKEHGVSLVLYPHRRNWIETTDDCLRVAKKVDRPNVGVMFNLCHWMAADSDRDLKSVLRRAMPKLTCVTINGCDPPLDPPQTPEKWIVPLDEGSFDVRAVLQLLDDLEYRGPVGLQCYGIGGDAQEHLARSIARWNSWFQPASEDGSSNDTPGEPLTFDPTAVPTLQWLPEATNLPESVAETEAEMRSYRETVGKDIGFEMVPIRGGTFWMGSPDDEPGRQEDEGPRHEVRVEPFWIGRHEVTWDEYNLWAGVVEYLPTDDPGDAGRDIDDPIARRREQLADAVARPSKPFTDVTFGMGESGYPAFGMTQLAARCYCKWLSAKTGRYYRLPTEAEWEYACRAGTTTAYSYGDDEDALEEHGWFFFNADDRCQKVGQKKANAWGLFDMHGNVAEWVLDAYDPEFYGRWVGRVAENPWLPPEAEYPRVARGGCWDSDPEQLRSAARQPSTPEWKEEDPRDPQSIWQFTTPVAPGFRVVRPLRLPTEEEAALFEPDYRTIQRYHSVAE